ncbi:DUF2158 domain-containing protein [Elizabethkingia anophelis]|nr:DUF2158 domain-containing protein [Elizabethkingia anophelis]MDV3751146.1 DUF2158 domain-containing protein [Elizabethkingia anophelis]MDV3786199.1 DUF2158 domain-containing protein [Elizabethkingia anophelis]
MKELSVGDVVHLKSDKSIYNPMTINARSAADGKDFFVCVWFINGELKQGIFHKEALKLV